MIRKNTYRIIDRSGNVIFSESGRVSLIGNAGFMLITGENASSLFNPYTRTIKPLPSTIGDKPTLFNPALHPQSDLVVGHCLDSLGVLKRKISDDCNGIPEGKTITSSFALNSEGELLFEPVPLFLFFSGKDKLVGYNRMKSLFLLDRKGEILHEYEKCFRYDHCVEGKKIFSGAPYHSGSDK